ncbi:oligosaccharide flippase family protein [Vibrio fluvialis]|nr:oligosaccharide flippase family protein [Vibrio fluvialis]
MMKKIGGALLITLLQSAVSLVAQIVLARILSPNIFGQFATCSVLVTILMALANLQCDKYIISGKGQTVQDRLKASAYIELIVAIMFFILALSILPMILKLINKDELIYYSLALACSVVYTPFTRGKAVLDSELMFFKARLPQLCAQIISATIAIFLALNEYGLSALIIWRLCAYFIEILILTSIHGSPKFKIIEREERKAVIGFVKPLYWSSVIFTVYASFDYYVLAIFISDSELGLYWLSFQLTNYLLIIKTTFNNILLPYYCQSKDNMMKVELLNNHTKLLILFYLVFSIVSMMISDVAINIVLGEKWSKMTTIFNLFTIIVMFKAFSSSFLPYLIAVDKRKAELQSTVFALLNLTIFLPILSLKFGVFGALVAVMISTFLNFIYLYCKYIYEIKDNNHLKTFSLMILVSIIIYGSSFLHILPRLGILTPILLGATIMIVKNLHELKNVINKTSGLLS